MKFLTLLSISFSVLLGCAGIGRAENPNSLGVTESYRKLEREDRVISLPLSPLFSLSSKRELVSVEDSTQQGADPKMPRPLKSRATAPMQLLSARLEFVNSGVDLLSRMAGRGFYVNRTQELALGASVASSAQGGITTNLILLTNEVFRSLGPSPDPAPRFSVAIDPVYITETPFRSRNRSVITSWLVGPLSSAFGLDFSANGSEAWTELKVCCAFSSFLSQKVITQAEVTATMRRLDHSLQVGLRMGPRHGLSGSLGEQLCDSTDMALASACAEALGLAAMRLAGLPPKAVGFAENDSLSRSAIEKVWVEASVEARRASVSCAKLLCADSAFFPPVWPDPQCALDAALWRSLLEDLPIWPCQPFDPAPESNAHVGRHTIRIVFEYFGRKWAFIRPQVLKILENGPFVTAVSIDPAATEIGFLISVPQDKHLGLRDYLIQEMRKLTGLMVDWQVPSGYRRTLYIQYRPSM